MNISVVEVKSNSELKAFIKFPMKLYRSELSYVPPLVNFELSTLDEKKNPAFDHSEAKYWLVKSEGKTVGRIAGIILQEELQNKKLARFGWIDFVDELAVSEALFEQVSHWAVSKGANRLHGPLGFTDLDFEGALIEGFDQIATQATIYNYPYYQKHYESHKFEKAVDWVEYRGSIPNKVSERLARGASLSKKRYDLKAIKIKKKKHLEKYATAVFELLNITYQDLYGYNVLSKKQIDYYKKQYFGFINKEFLCLVANSEDELAGVAICIPSISKGLQKAKGSLFPFGFIHILKDFLFGKSVDVFLIGVLPKYQSMGVPAVIFDTLHTAFIKNKVTYLTTGPMLEGNAGVRNTWKTFDSIIKEKVKRRCYIKSIGLN